MDPLFLEIALKTDEPVYIKQFKIPDARREEVEKHIMEWLKLGFIKPDMGWVTALSLQWL